MFEKFESLPNEKQENIMRAMIQCFSVHGYSKTSVNDIAKKANVSKALLFHYFENKEHMYIYTNQYVNQIIVNEPINESTDFFEIVKNFMRIRSDVDARFPGIYNLFLEFSKKNEQIDIPDFSQQLQNTINQSVQSCFENVNWNKFKNEIDKSKMINLVTFVGTGCMLEYSNRLAPKEIDKINCEYLDMIKQMVYKEEYL